MLGATATPFRRRTSSCTLSHHLNHQSSTSCCSFTIKHTGLDTRTDSGNAIRRHLIHFLLSSDSGVNVVAGPSSGFTLYLGRLAGSVSEACVSQITQNAAVCRSRIYCSADDESKPLINDSTEVWGEGRGLTARWQALGRKHTHTHRAALT